ncbi:MAG: ATP-binding protein, partial [Christensenellaceae bacterium]|nr:ATP-binding protein [Christensenellaceae bacterium]
RVEAARAVQRARYAGQNIACNARLPAQALNRYCPMDAGAKVLIKAASDRLDLSSRAYTRVLKLARTIADMEGRDVIGAEQVAEAVQYRSLDKKYWG